MSKAVVFDIEGTVCPISFVKETLFPFALDKIHELAPKLQYPVTATSNGDLESYVNAFPDEYKASSKALLDHIDDLTARDVKAPYLKALQGYLWKFGYQTGEIKAPIYGDAVDAIARLKAAGVPVYIYSSGSVPAQKLLFAHSNSTPSDITPQLSGYYDTINAGPKTETQSYQKIASDIAATASEIHFFSDNPLEIEAARAANWTASLVIRPGNAPLPKEWANDSSILYNLDSLQKSPL